MHYKTHIFRVIDANTNRAKEGLRVCEDIVRLLVEDKHATQQLKNIRHAISGIINTSNLKALRLSDYRDSHNDIGKNLPSDSPKKKIADVFYANVQRAKEAIRVLEEVISLFDTNAARRFLKLRFKLYNAEKECLKKIRYLCDR